MQQHAGITNREAEQKKRRDRTDETQRGQPTAHGREACDSGVLSIAHVINVSLSPTLPSSSPTIANPMGMKEEGILCGNRTSASGLVASQEDDQWVNFRHALRSRGIKPWRIPCPAL